MNRKPNKLNERTFAAVFLRPDKCPDLLQPLVEQSANSTWTLAPTSKCRVHLDHSYYLLIYFCSIDPVLSQPRRERQRKHLVRWIPIGAITSTPSRAALLLGRRPPRNAPEPSLPALLKLVLLAVSQWCQTLDLLTMMSPLTCTMPRPSSNIRKTLLF